MAKPKLRLEDLAARHPGLTQAIASVFYEAAKVCLDRHHTSPVDLQIDDNGTLLEVTAQWDAADERTKGAWANEIDTTETGAYGVVLAAVEVSRGLVAVRRAETRTGADYYVAPPSRNAEDLEHAVRLEISGVDAGAAVAVQERLQLKIRQLTRGKGNLPALAGVVGFRVKLVALHRVEMQ